MKKTEAFIDGVIKNTKESGIVGKFFNTVGKVSFD